MRQLCSNKVTHWDQLNGVRVTHCVKCNGAMHKQQVLLQIEENSNRDAMFVQVYESEAVSKKCVYG